MFYHRAKSGYESLSLQSSVRSYIELSIISQFRNYQRTFRLLFLYVSGIRYFQRHLFTADLYPLIGFSLPEFNHYGFLPLSFTFSFSLSLPRVHLSPSSFQYPKKSSDTFSAWTGFRISRHFLRYTSSSFLFCSAPVSPPHLTLSASLFLFLRHSLFLLTDDACLDQHSLRETRGVKDVFIEKLRRHGSSNLTVTMGNAKRRI